jgi:hypothetical protein
MGNTPRKTCLYYSMNKCLQLFQLVFLTLYLNVGISQNNIGVGTPTPHPSAVLDLDPSSIPHLQFDHSMGFKIPYTDTNAVNAFANSFTPPQPIAHGLLIFQKGAETYYYYHAVLNKWIPLIGQQGLQGPRGDTGVAGPRGRKGITTTWRSGSGSPGLQTGDSCGDFYLDLSSAIIYKFNCPGTWTYIGGPYTSKLFKGETIRLTSTARDTGFETSVNTTVMKSITGLKYIITSPPGYSAHAMLHAYGTVTKVDTNDDYNYAKFDFYIGQPVTTAHDMWQVVSMGPTGDSPEFHNEHVSWSIGTAVSLGSGNTVEVRGGQQIRTKTGLGDIILADSAGTENEAHLDIMIYYVRD